VRPRYANDFGFEGEDGASFAQVILCFFHVFPSDFPFFGNLVRLRFPLPLLLVNPSPDDDTLPYEWNFVIAMLLLVFSPFLAPLFLLLSSFSQFSSYIKV